MKPNMTEREPPGLTRRQRNKWWSGHYGKNIYPTLERAQEAVEKLIRSTGDTTWSAYKCPFYNEAHVGHKRGRWVRNVRRDLYVPRSDGKWMRPARPRVGSVHL